MKTAIFDREERKILFVTGMGHALVHAYMWILPAVLLRMETEFGTTMAGITALATVSSFLFGVGAFPAGFLADRITPKKMLSIYFGGTALAAMAITLTTTRMGLLAALAALGLFASPYHPAGLSLISHGVRNRGKGMGIHGVFGNLGMALAPAFAAFIANRWSWRIAYAILSAMGAGLCLFAVLGRFRTNLEPVAGQARAHDTIKRSRGYLLLFYAAMALNGFVYRGFATATPKYLSRGVTVDGMSDLLVGGIFTTIALLFGASGQFLWGHLSDIYRKERIYLITVSAALPLLAAAVYFRNIALVTVMIAFAFVHFANQPVENSMVAESTTSSRRSLGYGMKFILAFGFGSAAAWVAGVVGDSFGLSTFYAILAAVTALSALLIAGLQRRR